jgi:hypothetical protein
MISLVQFSLIAGLIAVACISLIMFFINKKPLSKIIDLIVLYLSIIVLLIYFVVLKEIEDKMFSVLTIIIIIFTINIISGTSIILTMNKKIEEEYEEDEYV